MAPLPAPTPAVLDGLVEFVARDPLLVGIVVVMLAVVFFVYLFVRRTMMNAREGYEEAYRR